MIAARRGPIRAAPPGTGQRLVLAAALALTLFWAGMSMAWLGALPLLTADAGALGFVPATLEGFNPLAGNVQFRDVERCPTELGYGGVDSCSAGRSRTSRGR